MGVINKLGNKLDSQRIGLIFGLVLPILGFLIFWQWKLSDKTFNELYSYLRASSSNRNEFLIFPLIPNLLLFYFTNFQWRWDKFTAGLVAVTISLTVIVTILILL